MFGFLNGAALFAAAAALIPLIIHLFSRRRVKIVEFSSLKHLKAMQRRQVRRLKIRQILLLLLRMAIILAVVMAFARPTSQRGSVGAHASVSAVILLDNSASMNRYVSDGNLFEIARDRTAELLNTLGQSDEVCVIPMSASSAESEALEFGSPAVALEQLDRTAIGWAGADVTQALDNAKALLLKSKNLNKEIYLVTDRQRTSLPDEQVLSEVGASVYFVDLPLEDTENLGVVALDFGGQLIQPGLDFTLTATVKNYGTEDSGDRIASLFINGNRVAQTDFTVGSGAEATVRFTRAVSATGFHSGFVEISDDKFPADNRYYFSLRVPEKFNLLIVGADDAARFLNLALVPNQSLSRFWSVKESRPDQLAGVNFEDYDVVMLAGVPTLASAYVSRLKSFVRRGKSLFVVYGPETNIENFNQEWTEATGVTFDEAVRKEFTQAGFYTFGSIDFTHPIFSVFSFEATRPPEIKFFTLPKVRAQHDVRTLARFSGDRPALVEKRFGSGRVLTFTGPIGPKYSDLISQAFFVPFISRTAEYLASDLSGLDLRLFSGDNITRAIPQTASVNYPLDLVAPDSSEYRMPPEESNGLLVVRPRPTNLPGIYSVQLLGHELDRFAINLNPAECNLAAADKDQFIQALGAENAHTLESGAALAGLISEFRFGRELWQIFLWIALALVIVEMLLSRGAPTEE
jgi:hypothetical protein